MAHETANILNNATDRSLIILDEIGRGTSTYGDLSIVWSVVEHFVALPAPQAKPKKQDHRGRTGQHAAQPAVSRACNLPNG